MSNWGYNTPIDGVIALPTTGRGHFVGFVSGFPCLFFETVEKDVFQ